GKVAVRYEYDAWGLVTRMYNGLGERVREGIGWIGDLGTGNGSPGSVQGPEDESGNTEPDYHPGNGNNNGNGKGATKKDKAAQEEASTQAVMEASEQTDAAATDTVSVDLSSELSTVETEPTDDITTNLVKENPYRYAGYYWDRKTQYYYLQARYYDPRPARFISEDTYEGEVENPQSLNQYVYVENNPAINSDPTGRWCTATVKGKFYSHPGYCSGRGGNQYYLADNNALNFGRMTYNAGKETGRWYPKNAFYLPWDHSGISDATIGCFYDNNCFNFVTFGMSGVVVKTPSLVEATGSGLKKAWTWAKNLFRSNDNAVGGARYRVTSSIDEATIYRTSDGKIKIQIGDGNKIYTLTQSQVDELKNIQNLDKRWAAGSIKNNAESLVEHYFKHKGEVGATSITQYLNKAEGFKLNLRGATSYNVEGYIDGVVRYVKNGKYIDLAPDRSIVSFGGR
ncbi:RHS repeat-associated core domain-containing protein, partial [Paenibacillus glycanilyticus]|uniref:RHS repeat-associated core domain-containing protein n=1 Tax=Paenibacillus glycanilyticus TaxID=126569 RepID=UPI00295F407E